MTFKFKSLEDFEEAMSQQTPILSNAIYDSISQSYQKGNKTCTLFNISISSQQLEYQITLPKKQWLKALQSCLKDFEAFEQVDDAIDCYLLIKKLQ